MKLKFVAIVVLVSILMACNKSEVLEEANKNEWYSGGIQTVFDQGASAFSAEFPIIDAHKSKMHEIGDVAFEATFVSGDALINGGLGPIYNNVSCVSCHVGDGRGKAPENGEELSSLLVRISVPGNGPHGEPLGVPGYGGQFQTRAIFGKQKEGNIQFDYSFQNGSFNDGEVYELRKPIISFSNTYSIIPADVMVSPRVASPIFGLGLLEAIPDESILKYVDENDVNNDGISGKANKVWEVKKNDFSIGRFGWKAGQPSVIQQTAGAFVEDMGITNPIYKVESAYSQEQFNGENDVIELSDSLLHAATFYVQTLAVPARRSADDATVLAGKRIFNEIKCSSCHIAIHRTSVNVAFPEISNQIIFPYTDLLLHDLGEELADNRPEYLANGREWRTSPLWGIGLTEVVNGHSNFLHDGRARNLTEAILWHGGEGALSKNKFKNLSSSERKALLQFLKSL
jgi:CxxC motif-containing protein (DUF1111 family)